MRTPTDVANRALQHVGALLIGSGNLFTESSNNALQARTMYDICRLSELRKVVWRFATKRVALRKVTATTQLVTPVAWAIGTTYAAGALVTDTNNVIWQSQVAGNVGNALTSGTYWQVYSGSITADTWSNAISYYAGEIVFVSTTAYISLANANLNNAPSGGAPWLSLGAALSPLTILSPLGYGPLTTSPTKNNFRLPQGFLRFAFQDQKAAGISVLGTSAGIRFSDWELEGNYLVSSAADPILLRYCSDVTDVTLFDPLFSEALSARLAFELCEPLTQSAQKMQLTDAIYRRYMSEARKINSIEIGSSESDEDAYLPLFPAPSVELNMADTSANQRGG